MQRGLFVFSHCRIASSAVPGKVRAMEISYALDELVDLLHPDRIQGAAGQRITGIASLDDAGAGDLTFLGNPKYKAAVAKSQASVVLVPRDYDGTPQQGQALLHVTQPSAALAQLCGRIEQALWPRPEPGRHPSAVISPDAVVDPSATIGPLCVIEAGVRIEAGVHLEAQVFVGRDAVIGAQAWLAPGTYVGTGCWLGERVRLHAGVVIGSDGFGYEFVEGRHAKVPQVGTVVVEADVEIGANSTIDRARFHRTVIGAGTKIDNLVQVGHNVTIGKHCILCAQVGISGSTVLEDYVVLGGQAGAAGHLTIARGTKAGGRAAITADTEPGSVINGNPAMPYLLERRLVVLQRRLPDLFKRVDSLFIEIEELKKTSAS